MRSKITKYLLLFLFLTGCGKKDNSIVDVSPTETTQITEQSTQDSLVCSLSSSLYDEEEDIPVFTTVRIEKEEGEFTLFQQTTTITNFQAIATQEEYEFMMSSQKQVFKEKQGFDFDYEFVEGKVTQILTVQIKETTVADGDLKEMGIMGDFESMKKRLELDQYNCE